MPEGILCNKNKVTTLEQLQALLADKSGKQYYEEMNHLEVDAKALWDLVQKTCKSRLRTWLEICTHCGLCADSCFYYLANGKDPKQVPSYKIQSTLGEIIRRKGQVDNAFMQMAMDTAFSKCTCCTRCGVYCPMGIDTGVMFSYLRGLLFSQGFTPWEMKIGTGMHRVFRAQMDVSTEDWVETCNWMAEESADEWPGLEIPIDKENADIMYTVNAREPKHYPDDVAQAAILFHLAGENWTVPSEGWEETSLAMFAGDWEACKLQVESVYAAMNRLKPKRMVVTECGHAYRATVIEGPYWAGLTTGKPPVESLHYVEWVAEALRTGKLKIDPAKRIKEPVTYQDSCNYIRNGGSVGRRALHHEPDRRGLPRDDALARAQLLLRRRRRAERHRPLPGAAQRRPQGEARPDPAHRRQARGRPLSQLLGRDPGPGGGLPRRHPLELSQAAADQHGRGAGAPPGGRMSDTGSGL